MKFLQVLKESFVIIRCAYRGGIIANKIHRNPELRNSHQKLCEAVFNNVPYKNRGHFSMVLPNNEVHTLGIGVHVENELSAKAYICEASGAPASSVEIAINPTEDINKAIVVALKKHLSHVYMARAHAYVFECKFNF